MIIRLFEVIYKEWDNYLVTNGEYSVIILGQSQAYMVCNMINGLVSNINFHNNGLKQSIKDICNEINERDIMTTIEVSMRLQELLFEEGGVCRLD